MIILPGCELPREFQNKTIPRLTSGNLQEAMRRCRSRAGRLSQVLVAMGTMYVKILL